MQPQPTEMTRCTRHEAAHWAIDFLHDRRATKGTAGNIKAATGMPMD